MKSRSTDPHAAAASNEGAAASNEGAAASHSQPVLQKPEDLLTITTVMKARGCKSPTTIWIRSWQDSDVGLLEPANAPSAALSA
jgi:hypothetical protein